MTTNHDPNRPCERCGESAEPSDKSAIGVPLHDRVHAEFQHTQTWADEQCTRPAKAEPGDGQGPCPGECGMEVQWFEIKNHALGPYFHGSRSELYGNTLCPGKPSEDQGPCPMCKQAVEWKHFPNSPAAAVYHVNGEDLIQCKGEQSEDKLVAKFTISHTEPFNFRVEKQGDEPKQLTEEELTDFENNPLPAEPFANRAIATIRALQADKNYHKQASELRQKHWLYWHKRAEAAEAELKRICDEAIEVTHDLSIKKEKAEAQLAEVVEAAKHFDGCNGKGKDTSNSMNLYRGLCEICEGHRKTLANLTATGKVLVDEKEGD